MAPSISTPPRARARESALPFLTHNAIRMTTVLVCDDNPAVAEQYAYDLRRLGGYEVLVAHGGDEALGTLATHAIDCLILDLEMPGTDGFAVLRAMRERELATPVIVYTGTGDFD